ncbi:MAG: glycosyltransferase N-terminal domain-containing protein [Chitinophagales bacterium]
MKDLSLILYQFILRLYHWAVLIAAKTGNIKAKALLDHRKLEIISPSHQAVVWIHAASAGEGNQAIPIAETLKKKMNCWIVVSFFSPSGFNFHKSTNQFDQVILLPADSKKNANILIQKLNPKIAIFVYKEFWYNYLNALHQKNIPTYLVNTSPTVLSGNHYLLKYFDRKCLQLFTKTYWTSLPDKKLSKDLSISKITGNSKFESSFHSHSFIELKKIEAFTKDHFTIILGSSWPKEEAFFKAWLHSLNDPSFRVIIAPHDISSARIKDVQAQFKNSVLYSQFTNPTNHQLMILDEIGLLRHAYHYADLAIVGGGFGKGIHNILEAVTFKLPTFFGPNFEKFEEAVDLLGKQLAFSFSNQAEFNSLMNDWVLADEKINTLKTQLAKYIDEHSSIAQKIVEEIIKDSLN